MKRVLHGLYIISVSMNWFSCATWENNMMQQFLFSNATAVNSSFDYGDGSAPVWATLATFNITTAGLDSGLIFWQAGLMTTGLNDVQGVLALRLDGTTIIGTSMSAINGWGIVKFNISASLVAPPVGGRAQSICAYWPIATTVLSVGVHTLEVLGSWISSDFDDGWNLGAGAVVTFVGFPSSVITM